LPGQAGYGEPEAAERRCGHEEVHSERGRSPAGGSRPRRRLTATTSLRASAATRARSRADSPGDPPAVQLCTGLGRPRVRQPAQERSEIPGIRTPPPQRAKPLPLTTQRSDCSEGRPGHKGHQPRGTSASVHGGADVTRAAVGHQAADQHASTLLALPFLIRVVMTIRPVKPRCSTSPGHEDPRATPWARRPPGGLVMWVTGAAGFSDRGGLRKLLHDRASRRRGATGPAQGRLALLIAARRANSR
jgi:hypothetical protein